MELLLTIRVLITVLVIVSPSCAGTITVEKEKEFQVAESSGDETKRHLNQRRIAKMKKIERAWWNWNICQDAFNKKSCVSQNGVPDGYIFLAGQQGDCATIPTRTCTIAIDPDGATPTIFFPVINFAYRDFDDDGDGTACPPSRGQIDPAVVNSLRVQKANYIKRPYAKLKGRPMTIDYIVNANPYYLKSCPNKKAACCDGCDNPVCEDCKGVDIYPSYGYYVMSNTGKWRPGETRVYEFGANIEFDSEPFCPSVKYILKAVKKG